jgi:polysaccharide export outer membrane protein
MKNSKIIKLSIAAILLSLLLGCSSSGSQLLPVSPGLETNDYLVGPGDQLQIFVWRNPDLSSSITVRPDGRISSPLIDDFDVTGFKPVDIAKLIEDKLSTYIRTPRVTVMVSGFNSTIDQQIRVIGNATNPRTIPYRVGMTLLDVMIEVQGLSEFADGDNAKLIRKQNGVPNQYTVELDSLIRGGDITKNRPVAPGDTIIIPESWF